jgi:hypothetical protein
MVQMKYFGDSRDYFKYDLITFLLKDMKIRNYVFVPMLTIHRDDNEGKKPLKAVGGKSEALRVFIEKCHSKSLTHWKTWLEGLEGHLINYKTVEPVDETYLVDATRDEYWGSFVEQLQEKEALIFIDPDTGLESGNSSYLKKMGREKYILNDETESLRNHLDTSSVLMIYQHLPKNKHNHEKSVMKKLLQLKASNENCFVCGYREDDLAFLFLSKSGEVFTRLCNTLTQYDAKSQHKDKTLFLSTKEKNECTDVSSLFEAWRLHGIYQNDWGLAWFLAYQFCRRFYASHGVVPHVIEHEGLGYYGIQLDYVPCKVNQIGKSLETIGRLTCAGDVENWQTGGPGDHGLETSVLCQKGVPTSDLLSLAIKHMGLPTYPSKTHINCRHKRWGSSFELMFEIATILALRNSDKVLRIWNHPYHTEQYIRRLDHENTMQEHPGAFIFENHANTIVIAGDGRCLDGSGNNLWEDYMHGFSPYFLAICIENQLKIARN